MASRRAAAYSRRLCTPGFPISRPPRLASARRSHAFRSKSSIERPPSESFTALQTDATLIPVLFGQPAAVALGLAATHRAIVVRGRPHKSGVLIPHRPDTEIYPLQH